MAKTTSTATTFVMMLTLTATVRAGSVLHVDDDAPPGGDGMSWKTAYRFLQDALAEAADGGVDEIRVGQGLYRPDLYERNPGGTIDQNATFELIDSVVLSGGYAGFGAIDPDERDIELFESILTGYLDPLAGSTDCCVAHDEPGCQDESCEAKVCFYFPDCCTFEWEEICVAAAEAFCGLSCSDPTPVNSFHVVTVIESTATIDGLTIRDGLARFPLPEDERNGGGVLNIAGALTVIDCRFISNRADNGGGIYNQMGSATMIGCEFITNDAFSGGAIYNLGGDPNITDCTFLENTVWYRGGGVYNDASDATITSSHFIGNVCCGEGGGGIFNENSSPMVIGSTFDQNIAYTFKGGGGGIFNKESSPTLLDCTFISNSALGPDSPSFVRGGGMFNRNESNPLLINCSFIENLASNTGFHAQSVGGGLSSLGSNPIVIECTFYRNEANYAGGGIETDVGTAVIIQSEFIENTAPFGGGMFSAQADSSTIAQCNFLRNQAFYWAGAVLEWDNSSSAFVNCTFFENSAIGGGAAASFTESQTSFTNCTFSGNVAEDINGDGGTGGALASYSPGTNVKIVNCTISTNFASISGGGVFVGRAFGPDVLATASITNSILWNNLDQSGRGESAQIFVDDSSPDFTASVNYSTINGLTGKLGGIGNIGDDPMFIDPDSDDYRLSSGSPSIDAGNNWGVPLDGLDFDEDGVLCELFPADLDGNPRFNADEADFDPGCGVPVVVDMGAYEYQFAPVDQVTFADLNGDNTVGAADLLGLLVSWGPCAKGCCLADLDIDGNVGISDLLALLANWGPCP